MLLGLFHDQIPGRLGVWLMVLGLAGLSLSPWLLFPRIWSWGIPALIIISGMVTIERQGALPAIPALGRLGDASYAIYLFQVISGYLVSRSIKPLLPLGFVQFIIVTIAVMAASIAIGLAAHLIIERPVLRWLRRLWGGPRSAQARIDESLLHRTDR